jgi:uncharacterized membrane protein
LIVVALLFLAALLVLSSPIISLIVLVRTGRLTGQSERLERSISSLNDRLRTLSTQLQSPGGPSSAASAAKPQPEEAVFEQASTSVDPALPQQADIRTTLAEKIEESNARSSLPEWATLPEAVEPSPPPAESIEPSPVHHASEAADPSPASTPAEPEAASNPPSQASTGDGGARPPVPPPHRGRDLGDLERSFGTQWVVWIGGVALALGGIFLVRYSIEQGYFGPGLRVIGGAILALVLVGLGELARRREIINGIAELPNAAHIPSILTAAGTTCAYADVYAAYALYHFLSPALAFVMLGAVALATLAAALRHGPALGGLGLVGAYVTPLLVSSIEPNYWALYIYLAVVTAAAFALARVRLWRWLAITAAVLSILWMLPGMADPSGGSLSAHAFYAIICFTLAAYFIVAGLFQGPAAEQGRYDEVSCGVLAGYLLGTFLLLLATHHDPLAIATLFILIAATVAIAWRTEAAIATMPVAAVLAVLVVGHWALDWWFVILAAPSNPLSHWTLVPQLADLGIHAAFAGATAALFGFSGFLAQGRSRQPVFSVLWAVVAVATPLILIVTLYYRITQFDRSIPFAGVALLLAALFAIATEMLSKRAPGPGSAAGGALFATGAVAALALTLTFALEKGWLTIALSLMVPGIAWIAERRPLPMLRKLCGGIAALVLARVGWDLRVVGDDFGTTPIFNWILYGYGLPAVAFWTGARILRRRADDTSVRSVESAAILFTAIAAFLEIRHFMNHGDVYSPKIGLGELGLQVSVGLAMVIGLEHMRARSASIVHDLSARIIAASAFATIVVQLLYIHNPLVTGVPVGGIFFNEVLLGYGITAILIGILAHTIRRTRPKPWYLAAAMSSIAMMLIYLSLEVRTIFQGPVLDGLFVSDAEDYAYSAVWLTSGVGLLLAGVALRSQPARLASAAVVTLTILKVFLHDLAGVQGIYRALSFIGLGLVLMGIGWLYQRLLFPRRMDGVESQTASP